jgi:hypothetical protein
LKSDHWFYRVFQALPDLIRWLPANDADSGSGFADQGLAAAGRGLLEAGEDSLYRFSAPELKALSHRLDGLLWPRDSASGSEALPVVILEVQMHSDPVFHHRLAAETFRFLQQQPQVRHLRVVVLLALQSPLSPVLHPLPIMLLHSQRILLHRRLVAIGYKRRFVTRLRQEPVITEHLKCRTITCILLHILPAHLMALNVQLLLNFISTMRHPSSVRLATNSPKSVP